MPLSVPVPVTVIVADRSDSDRVILLAGIKAIMAIMRTG